MNKQTLFIGFFVAFIFFFVGRYTNSCGSETFPSPEQHMQTVFEYLQKKDLNAYKATLLKEEIGSKRVKKYSLKLENCHNVAKRDNGFKWSEVKIEKIKYKLKGNTGKPYRFKCDARIYFKHKNNHYKVNYKEMIYHNGKWYGGYFSGLDNLSEMPTLPDFENDGTTESPSSEEL